MSLKYGFYNSLNHDRVYDATDFSAIFDGIINEGVFDSVGQAMTTAPGTGMQVIVRTGRAWFDSTWTVLDADYPVALSAANAAYPRIDAIVLETSTETRENTIHAVAGTPTTNPGKPALTATQHALAYVTVAAGATSISASDIEIVVGTDETPFVTGILETADISDLFAAWGEQFQDWFDNLHYILDGDVAGHLQNEIEQLSEDIGNVFAKGDLLRSANPVAKDGWILCGGQTISQEQVPADGLVYPEMSSYAEISGIDFIPNLPSTYKSPSMVYVTKILNDPGYFVSFKSNTKSSSSDMSYAVHYTSDFRTFQLVYSEIGVTTNSYRDQILYAAKTNSGYAYITPSTGGITNERYLWRYDSNFNFIDRQHDKNYSIQFIENDGHWYTATRSQNGYRIRDLETNSFILSASGGSTDSDINNLTVPVKYNGYWCWIGYGSNGIKILKFQEGASTISEKSSIIRLPNVNYFSPMSDDTLLLNMYLDGSILTIFGYDGSSSSVDRLGIILRVNLANNTAETDTTTIGSTMYQYKTAPGGSSQSSSWMPLLHFMYNGTIAYGAAIDFTDTTMRDMVLRVFSFDKNHPETHQEYTVVLEDGLAVVTSINYWEEWSLCSGSPFGIQYHNHLKGGSAMTDFKVLRFENRYALKPVPSDVDGTYWFAKYR